VTPFERPDDAFRLHVLVSYAYAFNPTHEAVLETMPEEWNLMLDSGAFTNFTKGKEATPVHEYAAFCKRNEARFWRIINLDRIGDPEASAVNFQALQEEGLQPIPVFQRGDQLASLGRMSELAGVAPVCVGGISQNVLASAEQDYVRQVVLFARERSIPIHLLGVGGEALFRIPVYSGDNSSWCTTPMYGVLRLWEPGGFVIFNKHKSARTRSAYVKPDLARTRLLSRYGLTWEDLRNPRGWVLTGPTQRKMEAGFPLEPGDDSRVYLAGARAWIRMARALAKAGRRQVFASPTGHLAILKSAWELERHAWVR
jgi:hypothetical protein